MCCDSAPFDGDSSGLKTAGLYDDANGYAPYATSMTVEDAPAPGAGGLEFVSRDDASLVAFCSFCGFAERIL